MSASAWTSGTTRGQFQIPMRGNELLSEGMDETLEMRFKSP